MEVQYACPSHAGWEQRVEPLLEFLREISISAVEQQALGIPAQNTYDWPQRLIPTTPPTDPTPSLSQKHSLPPTATRRVRKR